MRAVRSRQEALVRARIGPSGSTDLRSNIASSCVAASGYSSHMSRPGVTSRDKSGSAAGGGWRRRLGLVASVACFAGEHGRGDCLCRDLPAVFCARAAGARSHLGLAVRRGVSVAPACFPAELERAVPVDREPVAQGCPPTCGRPGQEPGCSAAVRASSTLLPPTRTRIAGSTSAMPAKPSVAAADVRTSLSQLGLHPTDLRMGVSSSRAGAECVATLLTEPGAVARRG